ncbi:MAG: histidine triad (HIT) family protein [Limisphaerales bacterium]|jgi:histidine triad (HIT) family protein
MPGIFARIVAGELPAYKIAEEDNYLAFLDINPIALGHALVIPKIETDYIFDLDNKTLAGMLPFAKKVGLAIESVVDCSRIGMTVIGLEVPHAHIHLVPIKGMHDIDFTRPRVPMTPEDYEQLAAKIREAII